VLDAIRSINVDELTPLAALQRLNDLRQQLHSS
jgi:hypothetical protein